MAADNLVNPNNRGQDQKVDADVDTQATPVVGYPSSSFGTELATGFIDRLEAVFSGVTPAGKRVGRLIASLPSSIVSYLSNIQASSEDIGSLLNFIREELTAGNRYLRGLGISMEPFRYDDGVPVPLLSMRQGHLLGFDLGTLLSGAMRKYVGVDAGAYVSPAAPAAAGALFSAVTFTGVTLGGRVRRIYNATDDMVHTVDPVSIVDPVGGAVGTMNVYPAIPSANAVLRIPYSSIPFAWNSATDALQTLAVSGDPPRINGPATFLAVNAANIADGTTQYVLPTANYARQGIQIEWTCAGATLLTFNAFGKIDDAAWAAAGTINPGRNINAWMQTTPGGVAFGAPPRGGATLNVINARIQDPTRWNSIAIEMTASQSAGNSTVTGTEVLGGGTA